MNTSDKKIFVVLAVAFVISLGVILEKSSKHQVRSVGTVPQASEQMLLWQDKSLGEMESMIQSSQDAGIIKKLVFNPDEVWIDPVWWRASEYDTKGGLVSLVAEYAAKKRGTNSIRLSVIDSRSGKQMAYYSLSTGFHNQE